MKFLLGEKNLGKITLDGMVLETHFSDVGLDFVDNPPTSLLKEKGADVAAYYACPVSGTLPLLAVRDGVIRYVPKHYPNYYTKMDGTFDDYLKQQFGGKERSSLRRKVKRFGKATGELKWKEYRTLEEFDEFHRSARELSEKTYQEQLLDVGLPEKSDPAFMREVRDTAAKDMMRGYILFDKDKPVAYLWCPVIEGVMYYDYCGYDPEYFKLSPGTVLLFLVQQKAFEDKAIRIFDFTPGEGEYKAKNATDRQECAEVFFFRPGPKALTAIAIHASLRGLTGQVATLLDRFGVKEKIRKFMRARSTE